MLRKLNQKKAQAVMGEYALVFIVAVAMTASMIIFFRRAIQARIYDARDAMLRTVHERTKDHYSGNVYRIYEPYYGNTETYLYRDMSEKRTLLPGATSGIFRKEYLSETKAFGKSQTAPPKDAK